MHGRCRSLDIVRGLAALSVVFTHWVRVPDALGTTNPFETTAAAAYMLFQHVAWADNGLHPGVVVFIVLSGFCIHMPVARQPALLRRADFWHTYIRRRFWRIAPVFWCGVALGLALIAATAFRPEFARAIACSDCPAVPSGPALPLALAARVGFLSAWLPLPELALGNRPLYTVVSEIWLYASYPLVLAVRQRLGWAAVALAALGLHLFAMITLPSWGFDAGIAEGSPLAFLIFWVLGAAAAEWTASTRQARAWWEGIPVLVGAGFVVSQYTLLLPRAPIAHTLILALAVAVSLAVWVRLEMVRPRDTRIRRGLAWLGERSYSLYVVHVPTLGFVSVLGIAAGLDLYWCAPIAIAVVTLLAYRFVEHPAHVFARHGRPRIQLVPETETAAGASPSAAPSM
jgi:peptidoglycan/LPS O-acetylase OafA/YrhL